MVPHIPLESAQYLIAAVWHSTILQLKGAKRNIVLWRNIIIRIIIYYHRVIVLPIFGSLRIVVCWLGNWCHFVLFASYTLGHLGLKNRTCLFFLAVPIPYIPLLPFANVLLMNESGAHSPAHDRILAMYHLIYCESLNLIQASTRRGHFFHRSDCNKLLFRTESGRPRRTCEYYWLLEY